MPSLPRFLSRLFGPFVLVLLAAAAATPCARAQFLPTGAGPFDYNTTTNWTGGAISGVFSQTPTAAQVVTFGTDLTLTTALTFNLGGTSPSLTLRGDGTDRTVTLGGDVSVSGTTSAITLGATTAGSRLNLVLGADRAFTVASGNALTANNVISGANALTKAGTGQLTLAGANTYAGATTVNAGTLLLNASGALAAGNNVVVSSNAASTTATLSLAAAATQTIGTLTLGGAGSTTTSTNDVTLGTGSTLTLGGTVTYDATGNPVASRISGGTLALGGNRTFNVGDSSTAASSDLVVSSVISGSGQSLTKTGAGRLGFQGSNTYDGGTIVNGGTVFLNNSNNLSATGSVTVNNTAGATSAFTLASNVTQTIGALTFGGAGGTATSVNNVTLNTGATLTLGGTVTFDATGNSTASTVSTISGGTLALGGNRTFAIADSTGSSNELTITSAITGSGQSITKTGAGRLTVSGANTYDGGTVVNGGQFYVNGSNSLAATGTVAVNDTTGGTTQFILGTGVAQTIGALTFGGAGGTATSVNNVTLNTGAALTLGGTVSYQATGSLSQAQINGTGTLALGGNRIFDIAEQASLPTELFISSGVSLSGPGFSLTKTGAGALGLEGASTYTGGTVVAAGALAIWNPTVSATGTGPVTVRSGARIRGIGIVGGPTTLEAGATAGTGGTGGTAGTLTFANGLTLNDGAVFNFQLGTTSDRLRLTGGTLTGATTSGSLTINLTAGTGFGAGTYTLFDFSTGGVATSSFDVSDFTLGTTVSGYNFGLAMAGSTLQLTASAIPEPSTYAAIFGALSLVGAVLWRRRGKMRAGVGPRGMET